MRRSAAVVLFAGALWHCAHAADDVGWYTAPAEAQSARSYWIAGPQGLVILGTQLLPAETDALLHTTPAVLAIRERMRTEGLKALVAEYAGPSSSEIIRQHGTTS